MSYVPRVLTYNHISRICIAHSIYVLREDIWYLVDRSHVLRQSHTNNSILSGQTHRVCPEIINMSTYVRYTKWLYSKDNNMCVCVCVWLVCWLCVFGVCAGKLKSSGFNCSLCDQLCVPSSTDNRIMHVCVLREYRHAQHLLWLSRQYTPVRLQNVNAGMIIIKTRYREREI